MHFLIIWTPRTWSDMFPDKLTPSVVSGLFSYWQGANVSHLVTRQERAICQKAVVKFLWENTVVTICTTAAVPRQELTPLPAPSDRGGPGSSGKGDELPSVPSRWESLFCKHRVGMNHRAFTHPGEDKALQHHPSSDENGKKPRAAVYVSSLRARSQACA